MDTYPGSKQEGSVESEEDANLRENCQWASVVFIRE